MNNQPLKTKQNRSNPPRHVKTPVITADLNPEGFPEQMFQFARDITTFLECVNEFPEFTDETVNACILVLQGDLGVCFGTRAPSRYNSYRDHSC